MKSVAYVREVALPALTDGLPTELKVMFWKLFETANYHFEYEMFAEPLHPPIRLSSGSFYTQNVISYMPGKLPWEEHFAELKAAEDEVDARLHGAKEDIGGKRYEQRVRNYLGLKY